MCLIKSNSRYFCQLTAQGSLVCSWAQVTVCVEFCCSPHIRLAFPQILRFPPNVECHAGWRISYSNLPLGVNEHVHDTLWWTFFKSGVNSCTLLSVFLGPLGPWPGWSGYWRRTNKWNAIVMIWFWVFMQYVMQCMPCVYVQTWTVCFCHSFRRP